MQIKIDGQTKKQPMHKMLLQTSIWELQNIMVGSYNNGGLKEAIYKDNNIIIIYSTLRNILPN